MSAPTRILLVDDHEVVRRGIRALLSDAPEFEVVGEARNGGEGLELVRSLRPHLALIDIRMGGQDGPALCQAIQEERLPTAMVILTSFLSEDLIQTCIRLGVRGYILKEVEGFDLLQSLRKIIHGESVLDPRATELLMQWVQNGPAIPTLELSAHDVDILRLVAEGWTNREIGRHLYLSEHTVKARVNDITHRLNAKNRVEAVMMAHRHGLL